MGWSGIDDFVSEATTNAKTWRQDFGINLANIGTVVAGRFYDLSFFPAPSTTVPRYSHGNYVYNGTFLNGIAGWTLSAVGSGWAYNAASHYISKSGASAETATQNTDCVNGTSYSVVYTISGYTGSGNVSISLGGTAGTNRTANGTYRETLSCGATANAPVVVTVATTVSAVNIDDVAITRDLAFTPYTDAAKGREAGIWHGGNVSTDTKHLLNMGCFTQVAAGAPGVLYLVDLLGAYPRIVTNSASVQTLNNTLTLPRYTDGKGVRAYYVLNASNGANATNVSLSYTNPASSSGRGLGMQVASTASAIMGHMPHTGAAANNIGPFLPLSGGDNGILTVESFQFTVASASAGFVDLVLCKPLAALPITAAFYMAERDFMNQLPSLPQIKDGAVLGLIYQAGAVATTACTYQGYIDVGWG